MRGLVWTMLLMVLSLPVLAQNRLRADTWFEEGQYEKAIAGYESFLERNDRFSARLRLARSYRMTGDLEAAAEQVLFPLAHARIYRPASIGPVFVL